EEVLATARSPSTVTGPREGQGSAYAHAGGADDDRTAPSLRRGRPSSMPVQLPRTVRTRDHGTTAVQTPCDVERVREGADVDREAAAHAPTRLDEHPGGDAAR